MQDELLEVIGRQQAYSPDSTPAMQRRGSSSGVQFRSNLHPIEEFNQVIERGSTEIFCARSGIFRRSRCQGSR
jgi:hypothetical protein